MIKNNCPWAYSNKITTNNFFVKKFLLAQTTFL